MKSRLRWHPGIAVFLLGAGITLNNPAVAETVRVQVKGLAFMPAEIPVADGDTVEWVYADFVAHTATARTGAWDVTLQPHGTGHTIIHGSGNIEYYCRFHPNMKGAITIKSK